MFRVGKVVLERKRCVKGVGFLGQGIQEWWAFESIPLSAVQGHRARESPWRGQRVSLNRPLLIWPANHILVIQYMVRRDATVYPYQPSKFYWLRAIVVPHSYPETFFSSRYTASVCSSVTVYLITWGVLRIENSNLASLGPADDYKFRVGNKKIQL